LVSADINLQSGTSFPERISQRRFLVYAILLCATGALYAATVYFGFVWDDFDYVVENYRIQGHSLGHLLATWSNPFSGQYAPVNHSVLAFIYFFAGLEPFGYHLVQVLLHAACVCLLYFVLRHFESARVAFLASLLFAVYPPNIETVAWISEIKSTLAFLFLLLSFWFFHQLRIRERPADAVLCAVFLILSLLSKINTVVAPAIFLLYDYRRGRPWTGRSIATLTGLFLITGLIAGINLFYTSSSIAAFADRLLDGAILEVPVSSLDFSSGYFGGLWVHLLNLPRLLFFYVRMIFFPHPLSSWHMFPVYTDLNWITGGAWAGLLGLLWLLYRAPRVVQFWLLWFVIFLSPVLQLVPNPTWVADRYLYIPAVGAFVLLSKLYFHVYDRIARRWARLTLETAMAAILIVFAWQTYRHLPAWQDDVTFWEATTGTCPTSAFCHGRWGRALFREGQVDAAFREFFEAVRLRPAPQYFLYLGDAYSDGPGDYEQALRAYSAAGEAAGALPLFVLAKIAKVHYLRGDFEEARSVIDTGLNADPDAPPLLLVNGFLEWRLGNGDAARASLSRVLELNALYPRSANPARFFNYYWGRPAEVGRLLADLGPI
jgi:tetratricopeptide (TPR) repeat protein